MGNVVFGFPIFNDPSVLYTPTYSGGSWVAGLPLVNLSHRKLSKVARSTNAALSSTRFRVNLGVDRTWRVVALPKTNFSPTAKWRVLSTVAALPFRYEAGQDISLIGGTFARATTATYVDRHGIVRTAASGELRDSHFINGERYVLLEPARTNGIWPSRNLTTNWTGAAGVAANAVGIDGTPNSATTLTDDDPAAFENRTRNITVVPNDSATHAGQIWIRKDNDETRFPQIGFGLTGGTTTVSRNIVLNTKTGEFVNANATGTGTATVRESPGGLWWIVDITADNNSTGNVAMTCTLFPSTRSAFPGSDSVAAVGSIVVGHVQVEINTTFCTSPIFTTTAAVTRNADLLTFPFAPVPQAMTLYAKFIELEAPSWAVIDGGSPRIIQIAAPNSALPRLLVYKPSGGGVYAIQHSNTTTPFSNVNLAPVVGDTIELLSKLFDDGSVLITGTKNGGNELSGALSTTEPLTGAWSDDQIAIGSSGTIINAAIALKSVRVMLGSGHSLATMQESVYDSGWLDGYPAGEDAETLDGINVSLVHIPAAAKTSQILDIQIDDSLNPDGYVDLARLIVAGGYQPTINMSYGAELGLEDDTERVVSDGGAAIYKVKPVRRTKRFLLPGIPENEAFANAWQIQRRLGKHGQLFFVSDAADTMLMHERSFLAVMRQLTALQYVPVQRNAMAFELVEEL